MPIIASGGAGKLEHFGSVFTETFSDGALAASVFHSKEIEIKQLKLYLSGLDIPIRI